MIRLHDYDLVIINSSAGKDSLCALYEVCKLAVEQNFPLQRISVSHQDLGIVEWPGTRELVKVQADLFGLRTHYSRQRNKEGKEETLLEYVEKRGKWPSRNQRYCTSEFKRGPGARVITKLARFLKKSKVLYVFGFRADESPARKKKSVLILNKRASTRSRKVYEWLPIHDWNSKKVWETIKANDLPYHPAYDLGMPRLSCCFCIFSPFDALVVAGKANPELLDKYIAVERKIKHTFRDGFSIASVKDAIDNGYEPKRIADWVM